MKNKNAHILTFPLGSPMNIMMRIMGRGHATHGDLNIQGITFNQPRLFFALDVLQRTKMG